ncbi:hypothetical protein WJX81_002919 [Elliptochloris bilobata]|uniref:Cupin type-1 domain-containing protein n=1 Tax=Elliptochloris bilobata TaxID=381761 RepID=A0AAW1S403_9CHLO
MGSVVCTLVAFAAVVLTTAQAQVNFTQAWSDVPFQTFPGGEYKSSSAMTFPGSTSMSAALFKLVAGGVRDAHWHNVDEWAYVINGTCRATVLEQGKLRGVDTWDYFEGDIWFFPANTAHTVVALADGCYFLTGYNNASFTEERDAFGLSDWLALTPQRIMAQALGLNTSAVPANLSSRTSHDGFLTRLAAPPANSLDAYRASTLLQPPQQAAQVHRFPLAHGNAPEVNNGGGYINLADSSTFPAATTMMGALVKFEAGGLRQLHWHTTLSEWQFIINGTFEGAVFTRAGVAQDFTLGPGDAGFAPRGSAHWLRNTGDTDAYMILMFDGGVFTNEDVGGLIGVLPASIVASSLNVTQGFVASINPRLESMVPMASGNLKQA